MEEEDSRKEDALRKQFVMIEVKEEYKDWTSEIFNKF